MERAVLEGSAQHLAGTDQVLLADDLVEASRPHAVGERGGGLRASGRGWVEQIHAAIIPTRSTPRQPAYTSSSTGSAPGGGIIRGSSSSTGWPSRFTMRAGVPTTVENGGTSWLMTKALAPILA